jgi:hypothetical protein
MRLGEFLVAYLPPEDRRFKVGAVTGLLVMLKNLLVSREPVYGVGDWAGRYAPDLRGLSAAQPPSLNDDRVGRCLDRLFDADIPSLTLAVVAHAVREFGVDLDELHNESPWRAPHGESSQADFVTASRRLETGARSR